MILISNNNRRKYGVQIKLEKILIFQMKIIFGNTYYCSYPEYCGLNNKGNDYLCKYDSGGYAIIDENGVII